MVDMSATLIHHGHIRLLKKSSKLGRVIVGLTTDDEIQARKGYKPEIPYKYRKEMLEAFKYVDKVVPTPWLINEAILSKYNINIYEKMLKRKGVVIKKKVEENKKEDELNLMKN